MDPLCLPSPLGCFHCHLPPPYHKATENDVIFLGRDLSVQQQRGLCCTSIVPFEHFQNDSHRTRARTYAHTHTHTEKQPQCPDEEALKSLSSTLLFNLILAASAPPFVPCCLE